MPQHHDHPYKKLFSFPETVRDLLTGFVGQSWVKELDFDTLEKLNNSYVTDDFRERSDDVIWRVKFRDQWLYVYLLIEFQSSVDKHMALRLLTYVGLLYQDLLQSGKIDKREKLPPVLPIVLYNGSRPWTAPQSFSELLQPMPDELKVFQPEQHYWLIDENRFSSSELEQVENITAAIIRSELAENPAQMARVAANLNVWLDQDAQMPLRRAIQQWLCQLLKRRMSDDRIENIHTLTEIEAMLAREDWSKKWIEEGEARGKAEGEMLILQKQLAKRFGPLPDWAVEKLQNATTEQLETWGEQIFDIQSLEEFFV